MKKLIFLFILFSSFISAQTVYGKWQDYFSYFNILDLIEIEDRLICATENGIFSYDKATGELTKSSKATGLHGIKVATIAYNEEYDYLFIGYVGGAFDIITPNGIEYFVDIPIDTDFQGDKAINHIYSKGDKAVFSMDFGVVIFDLPKLEFDETTYFRNGPLYYVVNEAIILDNVVIACAENGIYTHPIGDLIPNFNAWETYFEGTEFNYANVFNGQGIIGNVNTIYKTQDGANFMTFTNSGNITGINNTATKLSIIHTNSISEYDSNLNLVQTHTFDENITTGICTSSDVYGGTDNKGVIQLSTMETFAPDGPYNNLAYKVTLFEDQIYVAPGGRNSTNFFALLFNTDGYYHYKENTWRHIPHSEITQRNICELAVNPLNTDQVFGAVYANQGNIVTLNDQLEYIINEDNSPFEPHPFLGVTCISNVFDEEGFYYAVNSYVPPDIINTLSIKSPNDDWVNIFLELGNLAESHILIDSKRWVWVGCPRAGGKLIAYDTNDTPMNLSDDHQYVIGRNESFGNLPEDEAVVCVAQDKSNTIWIGTTQGLRIKRNPNTELENGNLDTDIIVVEHNGLPEEFLKDVLVLDIEVDEANNKWISTSGGVFYVSSNGKETKKFFDFNNSPLPSNYVTDIEIDPITGKVYFASSGGLVSYQGDFIEAGNEFGEIIVYPNPVRPQFEGNIVIKGLAKNAKVKITDINGNLVYQDIAKGGALEWNQINLQGKKVASGVYLALMLNDDNLITATTKFAIVR